MTRIGIISDTHGELPEAAFNLFNGDWTQEEISNSVREAFRAACTDNGIIDLVPMAPSDVTPVKVDFIIHAGDIGAQMILDELGAIAHTVAVLGNNDQGVYWCSDGDVRDYRSLTVDGVDIFVQHIPEEMIASLTGSRSGAPPLVKTQPALAIHGHTHQPLIKTNGRRITLCPGSPTRARNGSGHAAAIVDTENGRIIQAALIRLP